MPYSVMRRRDGCTTVVRTWRMAEVTASTTLIPTAFSRLSSEEAWGAWEAWEGTTSSSVELRDMDMDMVGRVSVSSLVKRLPSSVEFCHHVKILSSNIRNV